MKTLMQHRRSYSLRTVLLLTIGLFTLMISAIVTERVYSAWKMLDQAQMLRRSTHVNERLFDVIETFSRERGVAYSLLRATDPQLRDVMRRKLEDSHAQSQAVWKEALVALQSYNLPGLQPEIDKSIDQYAALQALFAQLQDHAMQIDAQDAAFAAHWFAESGEMIMQVQMLWMEFTRHFTLIDPIITQRLMFTHFLGIILRHASAEQAIIGGAIVGGADITEDEQAMLLQWHGVVEQGWRMLDRLADRSQLNPAILPYLKDAQSQYFTIYDMVREAFYDMRRPHGHTYPLSVELWLEVASQVADSLYVLKERALEQTRLYAESVEAQARRQIIIHGAILLVALLLCGYSLHLITRRVIAPIQRMIAALLQTASLPSTAGSADEIEQLSQVLRAFQKTAERSARLAAIVDSSEDAILSKKLDGTIESWNMGATHLYGYTAPEAIGQSILMLIPPDRRSEEQEILRQIMQGNSIAHYETIRQAKNGRLLDISLSISPIYDDSGRIVGASKIARDITARKQAEAQIRRYMRDLERSNKELDDFAYIASHDLKEPLRGIHNHSRFLLEDNADKLDAESVSRLNRLVYLTQRMERLVNDLLYFSRLGRQELAVQPTDMNEVVHDIETLLENFLEERRARILIPRPLPVIVGDKTRITEALRNLITNAIKYNDKAEKTVEVGFWPSDTDPNGKMMRNVFYVKDNGLGIAKEFHEEIFRIFKRLQNSKHEQEDGTGVGLTFVKKIIERHGGKIWLESDPGQGTVFYFTLEGDMNNADPDA